MGLPELGTNTTAQVSLEETPPLAEKAVKFRFMRVSEQKILLLAKESQRMDEARRAMDDILDACHVGGPKPTEYSAVQREWLFMRLVTGSAGREQTVSPYVCKNPTGDNGEICGEQMLIPIDYGKVTIAGDARDHLDVDVGEWTVRFTRPETPPEEHPIHWAGDYIQMIYNSEESFQREDDFDSEYATGFWESMPPAQSREVIQYMQDVPRLETTVEHTCGGCGHKHRIRLSGFQDFF